MTRSDRRYSGIVEHVSRNGTEIRFRRDARRYQSPKGTARFVNVQIGDLVTLAHDSEFPASLRTGRVISHRRPIQTSSFTSWEKVSQQSA
jgi:hypothetical protein